VVNWRIRQGTRNQRGKCGDLVQGLLLQKSIEVVFIMPFSVSIVGMCKWNSSI